MRGLLGAQSCVFYDVGPVGRPILCMLCDVEFISGLLAGGRRGDFVRVLAGDCLTAPRRA